MNFVEKLTGAVRENNSLVCVGLDPDLALMPDGIGVAEFNRAIIDATADLVCTYKPNLAFYEAMGTEGLQALQLTVQHVPENVPVIGDAKRGDIGNTARAYARALFDNFDFDAVTVNPYLGFDSIEPFIQYQDRGVFILCRTSNDGALDFQSLRCEAETLPSPESEPDSRPLFEIVARKAEQWNMYGNIGLVVGATYPDELKIIRQRYPDMPLLIPGVGAQGGELSKVVKFGVDTQRRKTIINSSRQILYASKSNDFAAAARQVAQELRDRINSFLSNTAS